MTLFAIDREKCKRDGICVDECPIRVIEIRKKGEFPSPVENAEELCVNCGHCVTVCPHGAFKLRTMTPETCPPIEKELLPNFEETAHLLKSRRSIRTYNEKPVERETLAKLIDVARYAPSGHNMQPVHWMVIEDAAEVRRLASLVVDWMTVMLKEQPEFALSLHFDRAVDVWGKGIDMILRGAPHIIIAYGLKDLVAAQMASVIALAYLEIAAYSRGIGACWAGYFARAAVSFPPLIQALKLPEGQQVYGTMMIGYPKYRYHRIPLRNEPEITWR